MKSFGVLLLFSIGCCSICYSGQDNGSVNSSIRTRNIGSPVIVSQETVSQQLSETTEDKIWPGYVIDSAGTDTGIGTGTGTGITGFADRSPGLRTIILKILCARSENNRVKVLFNKSSIFMQKRESTRRSLLSR